MRDHRVVPRPLAGYAGELVGILDGVEDAAHAFAAGQEEVSPAGDGGAQPEVPRMRERTGVALPERLRRFIGVCRTHPQPCEDRSEFGPDGTAIGDCGSTGASGRVALSGHVSMVLKRDS